ncbi:hypothetical protein TNCV_3407831 [Trichonephila clavipes]|nr:hypothetical protein TNCV_3407831 [Trichonephila clavipes]
MESAHRRKNCPAYCDLIGRSRSLQKVDLDWSEFTLPELSYALQNLDTIKSPGPDSIPGHFLSHLGILGRERLLYICNLSWKTGKQQRQWKSDIVILIHKPTRMPVLRQAIVLFLLPASLAN